MRPYVLHKCAASADGHTDHLGPSRLILSDAADWQRVDEARAAADAVLIGAATLRRDDPRLRVKSPELRADRVSAGRPAQPLRVVLTQSGRLSPSLRMFAAEPSEPSDQRPRIYAPSDAARELTAALGERAEVVALPTDGEGRLDPAAVLADLFAAGVRRVMIEGGAATATAFHAAELVDEWQLSVAPFVVGQPTAPRVLGPTDSRSFTHPFGPDRRMRLVSAEPVGDLALITWRLTGRPTPEEADRAWLARAIELSHRCPPSTGAFSVGAVVVSAEGAELAAGHSRESHVAQHAEESALAKLPTGTSLRGATLYSSLEPCGRRLSGRSACADHILAAGIRRVVFAWREPPIFVAASGEQRLRSAGVAVRVYAELAESARAANRHLPGSA